MKQIAFALATLLVAATCNAASFDCAKAGTKVEHMICDNPDISKLDDKLAASYKKALQDQSKTESIKQVQRQWLVERNRCADVACLNKAYVSRLAALNLSAGAGDTNNNKNGRYKMIRDTIDVPHPDGIYTQEKHAAVCSAFLKNLESFPPFPPMACDAKFKPEFTDFKTPEWHDIDVWKNRDLEFQILGILPSDLKGERGERILERLRSQIKSGWLKYQTALFDIDNDGMPDHVLARIHGGMCDAKKFAEGRSWRLYEVYDPVSRKVDLKKEKYYSPYWSSESLFSYKGMTYYVSFGGVTTESYFGKNDYARKWYIRLYRPIPMNQGVKQPIALGCKYLYLPPQKK